MHPTITVGFDGSGAARRAVSWAADEAELRQAPLRVVACLGAPATLNPWYAVVPVNIDAIRNDVGQCLEVITTEERSQHPGIEITPELRFEAPRYVLAALASNSDLLVLGSSGSGAIQGVLGGRVGAFVTAIAPCPVVLVPDVDAPERHASIAVGIDARAPSCAALTWALDEADRRDAELVLVHAWHHQYAIEIESAGGRDVTRADAAVVLDRALEHARTRTSRPVNGLLVDDLEVDAIARLATVADLVVVGSSRRGPLRSAVHGSLAHDIAARSPVPVVVVKPLPAT